jgi:cytochrome c peroxidase
MYRALVLGPLVVMHVLTFCLFAQASTMLESKKIELGRELFFDKRLSITKSVSCNSCHNVLSDSKTPGAVADSGTDNLPLSIGVYGAHGGRNAPTVWNSSLRMALFWDGRAGSLEEQAVGPIMNPLEMGMPNAAAVEEVLNGIPVYVKKFQSVFGGDKPAKGYRVSIDHVAQAIASFERTLVTKDSPFDRYSRGEKKALSQAAERGWQKFQAHACVACHAAPTFSSEDYFVRFPLHEAKTYDKKYHFTKDDGRYLVTREFKDRNLWRVPSLQNVAITGPYFHNGSVDSLEEAVRIMAKAQLGKVLPEEDVKDIVEFLKSLTGVRPRIRP